MNAKTTSVLDVTLIAGAILLVTGTSIEMAFAAPPGLRHNGRQVKMIEPQVKVMAPPRRQATRMLAILDNVWSITPATPPLKEPPKIASHIFFDLLSRLYRRHLNTFNQI